MELFFLTFTIIILSVVGLAIGILAGRSPIKGSCGGLNCIKGIDCGICKAKHKMEKPS